MINFKYFYEDGNLKKDPSWVYLDGVYYLYFTTYSGSNYSLSMSTTEDWVNFTTKKVLFYNYCAPSNVVKVGDTYYLFFQSYSDAYDPVGYCRMYYSTSTDLLNWSSPTLCFGRSNGWNGGSQRAIDANIYKEGSTYYMFYVGRNGNTNSHGYTNRNEVGYATTTEVNFPAGWVDQCVSAPLFECTEIWETTICEAPDLVKKGSVYYLLYSGGSTHQVQAYATASSISGTWTKKGQINITQKPWFSNQFGQFQTILGSEIPFRDPDTYYALFQGNNGGNYNLGIASSIDLINWEDITHTYGDAVESVNISEEMETMPRSESFTEDVSIAEGVLVKKCPSVNKSVFGTFKFGQRKFGKNIDICTPVNISEDLVTKTNGNIVKTLSDNLSISENKELLLNTKRSISDSVSINENVLASCSHILTLEDNIFFSESVAGQTTMGLDDVLTPIEDLADIGYSEGSSLKSDWKFLIKNSAGQTIASLTNARKRWFTQRLNDESEAGFILDADDEKCNASILVLGVNELRIEYKGNLLWAGQLVSARKTAKGNDVYWEVLAKDWTALLGKRYCGVETIREFTTTDAGEIAWALISEAQALTNGSFGITLGTIEPSIVRSPTYDKKNILEALKEMANAGQDGSASYGFDFEVTPEKVFNVYYPYRGTIRENVVFRYPGNCEDFEALVDSWGIVNQEWGLGQHWTGNTAVVSRADVDSQLLYKRREAIKNYRDMSVLTFLQDTVYQDVQWLKNPSTVMRFSSRVDAKSGILNYEVGDGVTVVCDKFDIDEWLWVYERKIDIGDNDQLKVTLTVGD